MNTTIHWFRQDLRLADNPSLTHAAENGQVLQVYILDDINSGEHKMGGASRWWLHHSLKALADLTDALPDLSDQHVVMPEQPIGKSTAAAMMSGAYFAQVGAIRQLVETYSSVMPDPVVVGTGGAIGQMIDDYNGFRVIGNHTSHITGETRPDMEFHDQVMRNGHFPEGQYVGIGETIEVLTLFAGFRCAKFEG